MYLLINPDSYQFHISLSLYSLVQITQIQQRTFQEAYWLETFKKDK